MAQDTLHILNEILKEFQQIKNELKPVPKSNWETYSSLYLSLIASVTTLLVSFSIFALTRKKDKKEFRGKLYGEIITEQLELVKLNGMQNHQVIQNETAKAIHKLDPNPDTKRNKENTYKELEKTAFAFLDAHKAFRSKVGVYIYFKDGKTKVNKLLSQLEGNFDHKVKPFPSNFKSVNEVIEYAHERLEEHKEFWKKHIDQLSFHLVECVRENV